MQFVPDIETFTAILQMPYGYSQVIKGIKEQLNKIYNQRLQAYSLAKKEVIGKELPRLLTDEDLKSEEFLIRNRTLLIQANNLGQLAKNAPPETKPIILYYAEQSLFAFFVYSLFAFQDISFRHGLKIDWGESWKATKVKISKRGLFPRIIDCYTMLDVRNQFSPVSYDKSTNSFKQIGTHYGAWSEPVLDIESLIKQRQDLGSYSSGKYYDIIDFIMLFFGSSLARYRPYYWHKVVQGSEGTEYIWFQKCFDRFELLRFRLVKTLLRISQGYEPTGPLNASDREVESETR